MYLRQTVSVASITGLIFAGAAGIASPGEWPKLFDHPPAGANAIGLVNADALKLGAAKLKHFKDGEQKGAAGNLLAELPDHVKRAAISAFVDFDSLEPVWETVTATFEKDKLPTPKGIAEAEGGYLDPVAGKPIVWSPKGRYIIPQTADRVTVYKPADRPAVSRLIRSMSQPAQPLSEYLKRAAERALDSTALVLAADLTDAISPVAAREKVASVKSLADANVNLDEFAKVLADIRGVTFSVTVEDQFMGELQFDFGSATGLKNNVAKDMVIEVFARRGILLAEFREWSAALKGKALVMNGPLDASSVVNLLSFFSGTPSSDDVAYRSHSGDVEKIETTSSSKTPQASKRYFTSVQRVLSECRDTKGLSVAERGVFNDKLSRKIDQLPQLNVDPELVDYGMNVGQLIRGAGLAIRSANVAAGGQKAVAASSYAYAGYGYGGFAFNDNTAYNDTLTRQAHAQGMQQHIGNMESVDNLTAEIRRKMTQKYQIEF
jgi:hypothetical protein